MVIKHGFVVAAVFGGYLGVETGGLVFGIVQLAEAIAEFAARDVQLKPLSNARPIIVGTSQGRDFGRMLHDKGGLPELFLYSFFKVQHLQTGQGALGQIVFSLG